VAPIIELINVEKQFADTVAVHPISLKVEEGQFLTFLGPSGCGKTTLLRILAGLEQPTAGEVQIAGRSVTSLPPYKRDVNLVFQNYALFPHMTVEQNVTFGLRMRKVPAAEQRGRLTEVLELTRLGDFRRRYPHELSGGQQQRVAIARAIVNKPKVLLLDEPLAALDLQLRKSLQLELKQLQHHLGITFIYVTHDQEEAMSLSDRIVVMNQGRIEQDGSPARVYRSPNSLFVATFIGENNVFRQGERLFAVRPEKIALVVTAAHAETAAPAAATVRSSGGAAAAIVDATAIMAAPTIVAVPSAAPGSAGASAPVAPAPPASAVLAVTAIPAAGAAKKCGIVETVVFVGNQLKLWIRIAPEDTLVLAYCPADSAGEDIEADPAAAWRRGTPVGLTWAEQDEVTLTP
jgi:spermidine/putrescine transport system ATP-binding protein